MAPLRATVLIDTFRFVPFALFSGESHIRTHSNHSAVDRIALGKSGRSLVPPGEERPSTGSRRGRAEGSAVATGIEKCAVLLAPKPIQRVANVSDWLEYAAPAFSSPPPVQQLLRAW